MILCNHKKCKTFNFLAVQCDPIKKCTTPDHVVANKEGKLTPQVVTLPTKFTVSLPIDIMRLLLPEFYIVMCIISLETRNKPVSTGTGGDS